MTLLFPLRVPATTLALLCLGLGAGTALRAQSPPAAPTPRPVPPAGPLLNKAGDFAHWTITSKSIGAPAPDAPPAASPGQKRLPDPTDQTISVTKTKTIRFEETTTAGGLKTQKWCVPDMQITISGAGTPVVSLPTRSGDTYYTDYSKSDFTGFEWISAQNFTGIEKAMGRDCLIFRDKVAPAPGGPSAAATACIDADSRLPVALQLGEEIRTYQFGPTPTAMLTLPPAIQQTVDGWRKAMRQAALPPGKP